KLLGLAAQQSGKIVDGARLIEIRDGVGMACGHADPEEKGLRQPIGRRCEPIWTVKTVPLSIT
ncbi:MAG TPA: hypothetical protein VIH72_01120, partial [Candidatus Acidoferrales bacterium]